MAGVDIVINWLFIPFQEKFLSKLQLTKEEFFEVENFQKVVKDLYNGRNWRIVKENHTKIVEVMRRRADVELKEEKSGARSVFELNPLDSSQSEDEFKLDELPEEEKVSANTQKLLGRVLEPGTFEYRAVSGLSYGKKFGKLFPSKPKTAKTLCITACWDTERTLSTEPRNHFLDQSELESSISDFLNRRDKENETKKQSDRAADSTERKIKKSKNQNSNRMCICGCGKKVALSLQNGFLIECPCFRRDAHFRSRIYRMSTECWKPNVSIFCALCKTNLKKEYFVNQC